MCSVFKNFWLALSRAQSILVIFCFNLIFLLQSLIFKACLCVCVYLCVLVTPFFPPILFRILCFYLSLNQGCEFRKLTISPVSWWKWYDPKVTWIGFQQKELVHSNCMCVWRRCVIVGMGGSFLNSHFRKMFVLSKGGTIVKNKTLS